MTILSDTDAQALAASSSDAIIKRDVLAFVNEVRSAMSQEPMSFLARGNRLCDETGESTSVIGRTVAYNADRPLATRLVMGADEVSAKLHVYDLAADKSTRSKHTFEVPSSLVWLFLRPFEASTWWLDELRAAYRFGSLYSRRFRVLHSGNIVAYVDYEDEVREILREYPVNSISEGYADEIYHDDCTEVRRTGDRTVNPLRFVGSLRGA